MKKKAVLASSNAGKIKEFNSLLANCGFDIVAQGSLGIEAAEETGLTFIENALLKARHASAQSGLPAFADDSGIEVDALNGEPGIYSARFAGEHASDNDNCNKLLNELQHVPTERRQARYQCVLVYLRHAKDPTPLIAQGQWEGVILESPRGDGGFGYDPLFWVPTHKCASAELEKSEKNRISHRALAMQRLFRLLTEQG